MSESETKHQCCVNGCEKKGKFFGKFGDNNIYYCKKHEYYGSKMIDSLVRTVEKHKNHNDNLQIRHKILHQDGFEFCPECGSKIIEVLNEFLGEIKNE